MKAYLRLALSFIFLVSTVAILYTLMMRDEFRISKIEVVTASGLASPEWIQSELKPKLSVFSGFYTWEIDLSDILNLITKDRRVKEAHVSRKYPNAIHVEVLPHKSLAVILAKDPSILYPLSFDGGILPPIQTSAAEDAPILRGERFLKDIELRNMSKEALLSLPENGVISLKSVSEVYFDRAKGLVFILSPDATEVILGHEDAALRLKRVQRVVEYLRTEQLTGRTVDARFSKKVVVRLRNEP